MAPVLVLRLKRASTLVVGVPPGLATKTASLPGLTSTSFALVRLVPALPVHPFAAPLLKHETYVSAPMPKRVWCVRWPGAVATIDLPSGVTATEFTPSRPALSLLSFGNPPQPVDSPVTHPAYTRRPSG